MTSSLIDFTGWFTATADLPPGVQHATYEALCLVSEEKVKMCYGTNVERSEGRTVPCLVNSVASMLINDTDVQGPCSQFPDLVRQFDHLNILFSQQGINTKTSILSPLGAEILVQHFAPLKEMTQEQADSVNTSAIYVEPSDEDMTKSLEALGYPSTVTEPSVIEGYQDVIDAEHAILSNEPPC